MEDIKILINEDIATLSINKDDLDEYEYAFLNKLNLENINE